MNKNIVRFLAIIILISPWIYVSSLYKDVLFIVCALVLLLATVDISKKKKSSQDNTLDTNFETSPHSNIENKRQNISTL